MTTTFTEGKHPGEFLISEAAGKLSRDQVTVTVPAGATYSPGQVLGQITADDKYAAYDDAASDGTETAAGVLYGELVNEDQDNAADMPATIINCLAEVQTSGLVFEDGVDEDAAIADLRALNIKARADQ